MINHPNSVWPNGLKKDDEGYTIYYPLGTNKVDVGTVVWPTGDKLISPYVYQNNKLVGFCDTQAMTVSSNTTISLPYTHIEADFSSIEEGKLTVNAPNATVKEFKWQISSNGPDTIILGTKYINCISVDDVKTVDANYKTVDIIDGVWSESLANLQNSAALFSTCHDLITFNSDLSSLSNGLNMFYNCKNLTTFNCKLPALTSAENMFYGVSIKTWNQPLKTLENGSAMFWDSSELSSFSGDLSNLKNGSYMFADCYNLTSFNCGLNSLTSGSSMFSGCKLNSTSAKNIIVTIKQLTSITTTLTIGLGCDNTTSDANLFAKEMGYNFIGDFIAAFTSKGWKATLQYNGRPTSTYDLRRTSDDRLPVFVKLIEADEYANYTSMDGTMKYRLDWFHETSGSIDGYTQFNSLEEAITHFNIKPIERN